MGIVSEKTTDYIRKLPSMYDQITFNQIKQKTGMKAKEVRFLVEDMIINKQIAAKISGNTVVFSKTELYDEGTGERMSPISSPSPSSNSQMRAPQPIVSKGLNMEKIWMVPIIGSVMCFIAMLTPAASLSSNHVWMIGFYTSAYYTGFWQTMGTTIMSITCILFILLFQIAIMYSANGVRNGNKAIDEMSMVWVISSILTLIVTIIWMVLIENMEIFFAWPFFNIGFGVIGLFIGGALPLITVAIIKFV